jgi:hypothetical protein
MCISCHIRPAEEGKVKCQKCLDYAKKYNDKKKKLKKAVKVL